MTQHVEQGSPVITDHVENGAPAHKAESSNFPWINGIVDDFKKDVSTVWNGNAGSSETRAAALHLAEDGAIILGSELAKVAITYGLYRFGPIARLAGEAAEGLGFADRAKMAFWNVTGALGPTQGIRDYAMWQKAGLGVKSLRTSLSGATGSTRFPLGELARERIENSSWYAPH